MLNNHSVFSGSRVNDALTSWPASPRISGENAQVPFLAARSGFAVSTIAGQFMGALYTSHYLWVIFAFQVVAAVLLLANRYVPLAVAVLARVIVNILVFHALMSPSGLPLALFVAVLWAIIFYAERPAFDGFFQSRS